MSKKRYTDEQIKELKANKYVMSCTEKSIQFTDEFRKIAMELDGKEFPRAIFKKCWFPDYVVNSIIPEKSFNRRRKSMREKWEIWLIDNRWRNWWKPRKNKIKKKIMRNNRNIKGRTGIYASGTCSIQRIVLKQYWVISLKQQGLILYIS